MIVPARPGRQASGWDYLRQLWARSFCWAACCWRSDHKSPWLRVATARPASGAKSEALLNASGYITPRRRATVAAKVTGRVEQIYAEEGLRVKSGQVLATLDCSQPNAALTSAKSDRDATAAALADLQVQSANADREAVRAQGLHTAGVISPQALDAAKTTAESLHSKIALTKEQVRAADSRIGVAKEDAGNCIVRAPFDGIVVSKDAQRGEIVSPISAGGGIYAHRHCHAGGHEFA